MEGPEVQSCDIEVRCIVNTDPVAVVDVDSGRRVIDKLGRGRQLSVLDGNDSTWPTHPFVTERNQMIGVN